ncbi:MAG: hypothetical protein HYZ43_09440 [Flavobacteriia bacterium]|nr:hypothetical protein [Flavobacteriia bacterium]
MAKVGWRLGARNTRKKVFLIMTSLKYIIADSGGSTTTWAFCGINEDVKSLETRSMHPKFLNAWTDTDWLALKTELGDDLKAPLFFYGAGCSQMTVQLTMKERLERLGFESPSIYPDTLAACRATCGKSTGMVAILGTGSVLLEYDGNQITNRVGGFGSLIGDEGSGFYVARLVVKDYLTSSSNMNLVVRNQLQETIGSPAEVLARLASADAQVWLNELGARFKGIDLSDYHRRNLNEWLDFSLQAIKTTSTQLSVIGSYGFSQRDLLGVLLEERSLILKTVCKNPMEGLIRFHAIESVNA